jgi:hypothetical protein
MLTRMNRLFYAKKRAHASLFDVELARNSEVNIRKTRIAVSIRFICSFDEHYLQPLQDELAVFLESISLTQWDYPVAVSAFLGSLALSIRFLMVSLSQLTPRWITLWMIWAPGWERFSVCE